MERAGSRMTFKGIPWTWKSHGALMNSYIYRFTGDLIPLSFILFAHYTVFHYPLWDPFLLYLLLYYTDYGRSPLVILTEDRRVGNVSTYLIRSSVTGLFFSYFTYYCINHFAHLQFMILYVL